MEINEIENRKIEKTVKTKSWFFQKINKIDKSLTRKTKKKERRFNLLESEMKAGLLLLMK